MQLSCLRVQLVFASLRQLENAMETTHWGERCHMQPQKIWLGWGSLAFLQRMEWQAMLLKHTVKGKVDPRSFRDSKVQVIHTNVTVLPKPLPLIWSKQISFKWSEEGVHHSDESIWECWMCSGNEENPGLRWRVLKLGGQTVWAYKCGSQFDTLSYIVNLNITVC